MPTRIELLKQAGFSDGEIGDWATSERQRMQEAGFSDGEIDDEFGVTRPPREVPPAFIERLKQGNWFHRALGAAGEYAQRYFGDEPLGFSPENKEALSKLGIVGDIIVPTAKPIDALLRSVPAGIAGVGAGIGQMIEEGHDATLGPGPYAKGKAARDFAQLAQIAALVSGANGPRTGAIRAPAPNVTRPAIALPRAEDFRNAAASITGNPASFRTEQKLLRLWTDHGIPPMEVAEDALHDQTIAETIRSNSEKLPETYVRNSGTTTASGVQSNAPAQFPEPGLADIGTVPVESRAAPTEAEARSSANLSASEPEHMIAESKALNLYDPPRTRQRPFAEDYGDAPRTDAQGRLLRDIEGRPLRAEFVAGRRFSGKPDEPLSPDDIKGAMEKLDIRFVELGPKAFPRNLGGLYLGATSRAGPGGDILINTRYNQADRDLAAAHEFGHAIDHFSGRLSQRLTQIEMAELRSVYGTLRAGPKELTSNSQPENFGYPNRKINSELLTEGLRAYMTNPNYFKTVAPRTAAKIRAAINDSPYLKHVIQFNSLGAMGVIGAGVRNQDQDDQ
jgi:hypothetical protein